MISSRSLLATRAWAIIQPDGEMYIDTKFEDEAHAWTVCLGWPSEEEIEERKAEGWQARIVSILS